MAVTPETIAVRLGVRIPEPDSLQERTWQMFIDDAEMFIEDRRQRLDVDEIDEVKLDYVIREAVAAHVLRPDDATQVTISVDDASSTKTFRSGSGRVVIKDEWWELLGLTEGSEGAYTLDLAPGSASLHRPWCALTFRANYCSCGTDIAGYPIYEAGS